jgi:sulfhydrogenase subunit delta
MASTGRIVRPRVAVAKFASCDGCQLTLLDLEEQLLEIVTRFDIVEFPEATSRHSPGPYDVVFVEGSISAPEHLDQIKALRKQARLLVTIGACATAGGIQALRNWANIEDYKRIVYPSPEFISTLSTSTPISEHVHVDFEIWGCPIDTHQLLGVIRSLLSGAMPSLPSHSVCMECKRRGAVCVAVAHEEPCLGPVTRAGCGAICPAMHRGCYGCFGPADDPNMGSFATLLERQGLSRDDTVRRLRGINGYVRRLRETSDAIAGNKD